MSIKIRDITEQWNISRTTVMKRIKDKKLIGEKDANRAWTFDKKNVVACFGEPGTTEKDTIEQAQQAVTVVNAPSPGPEVVIETKDETINVLREQLDQINSRLKQITQKNILEDKRNLEKDKRGFWEKLFS